ncbi:UDP-N-acetylmuramoylalanyl-D-glutamate--2,6-diaminopimelate ligase [Taibaiella sp. KBW10]|uniref:UDP-N-acetylmuramoyl-tripeptide--D-alanyl-D- alanine ligase n=1 Tax=Taibaiella sp. KBW10 TaxID=2153357 RepID=UPI000F5B33A2|nr:UDP-N-acetylmuramoyl-tripeptide--D-alanyl-D-alanine ligase [Taibaiella sp. KBW10]RQO30125.1 UDP-N-acetylmuramoylalanyl-D-glutamate--2,6-diaminopimelate ligase [Taibaiella sp. KBW10]
MTIASLYDIYLQHPQVQTDTRKLQPGDLYFALKGASFNGNDFVQTALDAGAAYCIVDEAAAVLNERCLLVAEVLPALQQLALHHRRQFTIPFIAITGTNGKTTTKELVTQVLSARYKTYATEGNLNNHIGVPLTILKIRSDAEMAIIEMGANHQKEIAFYCTIAEPDFGLINNVGKAHLEGFGSVEGIKKAKGELFDYLRAHEGMIFINSDLDYLSTMAQGINRQYSYGTANAQLIGKALQGAGLLNVAVLSSGMETSIQTQLVGDYNLPNVLAAIAIGTYFDMDIDTIKQALEQYAPSNSRSQLLQLGTNMIVLDAYNANPSSMKLAIENMAALQTPKTKWLMLGAMKEMGDSCAEEHKALVDLAEQLQFKEVILVGKEFEGIDHPYQWFETSTAAAAWLAQLDLQEAAILIKGSRGAQMELVLEALKKA